MADTDHAEKLLKIVCALLARPESEPFRAPVQWKALGLDDYPKIVKVRAPRKAERASTLCASRSSTHPIGSLFLPSPPPPFAPYTLSEPAAVPTASHGFGHCEEEARVGGLQQRRAGRI